MSSFAAIYDFEAQIEAALVDFLNGVSVAAMSPADLEAFQEVRPRTEAMLVEGGAIDSALYQTYDGAYRHQLYQGNLTLQIITDPDGTTHSSYRAKVRNMMARARQAISMDNLKLLRLTPSGNAPNVKSSDGYEMSTMTFAIHFAIKETAWPEDEAEAYPQ